MTDTHLLIGAGVTLALAIVVILWRNGVIDSVTGIAAGIAAVAGGIVGLVLSTRRSESSEQADDTETPDPVEYTTEVDDAHHQAQKEADNADDTHADTHSQIDSYTPPDDGDRGGGTAWGDG